MKSGQQLSDLNTASTNSMGGMNPYTLAAVFLSMFSFASVVYFKNDSRRPISNHHRFDAGIESNLENNEIPHERAREKPIDRAEPTTHDSVSLGHEVTSLPVDQLTHQVWGNGQIEYSAEVREKLNVLATAKQRVRHIRIAIENLNIAGLPEMAERPAKEIASIESVVEEAKRWLATELADAQIEQFENLYEIVRKLQEEVVRQQAEIKLLKQKRIEGTP